MNCNENAEKSGRTSNCTSNHAGNRRRRLAIALAAAGAILPCGHLFAQTAQPVFTTLSDWGNWGTSGSSSTGSVTATTAFDFDASTTDGLGSATPGATGTGGGLDINTNGVALSYNTLAYENAAGAVSENANQAFLSAWDPGATAAGGSSTFTTVAYSGTMYMVYSTPTWAVAPSYYSLGFIFQYPGNGYYGTFFPSSTTSGGIVGGYQTTIATYNYSVSAGSGGGLGVGIMINTLGGTVATSDIYVDDISFTLPVAPVVPANDATWATNGNGNWSSVSADNVNWVNSAPPATANSTATFGTNGGTITVSPTVNVIGTQGTSTMTFSNPLGYTLSGSGSIIQSGPINVTAGSNTINLTGALNISSGAETISVATGSSLTIPDVSDTTYGGINQTGGGTLVLGAINDISINATGTITIMDGVLPSSANAILFDIQPQAGATINLGANNYIADVSMENTGTVNIGTGTTLAAGTYGATNFGGSLTGSGTLTFGSNAGGPQVDALTGASPNFSGPINVEWLSTLQVGAGTVLGNNSSTNTLTLDSGTLQAIGNVIIPQSISIVDTQSIANNTTTIDTQTNTLTLSGQISGGNLLQKIGTGTLILAATNSYGGGTDVTAGTLVVGATARCRRTARWLSAVVRSCNWARAPEPRLSPR